MKRKKTIIEQQVDKVTFFDPPKIAATAVIKGKQAEAVQNQTHAFHPSVLEEFLDPLACRIRPEMDAQIRGLRDASREVHKDGKQEERLPGSDDGFVQTYINQVYFSKSGYQVTEQRKKEGLPLSVP